MENNIEDHQDASNSNINQSKDSVREEDSLRVRVFSSGMKELIDQISTLKKEVSVRAYTKEEVEAVRKELSKCLANENLKNLIIQNLFAKHSQKNSKQLGEYTEKKPNLSQEDSDSSRAVKRGRIK